MNNQNFRACGGLIQMYCCIISNFCDVFEEEPTSPDNPLLKMDNVIATPHSAGNSMNSRIRSPLRVGQEAARLLNGAWPMSVVNPEVRANLGMRPSAENVYSD